MRTTTRCARWRRGRSIRSCGFKFVRIKRLDATGTDPNTIRTCVAWVKGAVRVVRGARTSRITQRDDLSFSTQVYSEWHLGGTRVHDEAVVTHRLRDGKR